MHSVQVKRAVLVVALLGGILPASAFAWGGRYPTGDVYGSTIQINVSDTYPVDPALTQDWATFFGSLVHGRELASLTVDLAPLDEVQTVLRPAGARLLRPRLADDRGITRGSAERPGGQGDRHARVRPPRREQQPQHALRRRGVRHEALGVVHEHLQARRRRRALPGRRGRQLRGEPRRGVRRGLPRPEPDEAGCNLDRLGHRRSGALPERDRALDARTGHHDPVEGTDPVPRARHVRQRHRHGRSSRRPRSTGRSSPACTPRRSRACGSSSTRRAASSRAAAACATRSAASAH